MKVPKRLEGRVSERGMAIIATAVILLICVPVVGLAIDASVLFATKARLQAAVDGAALAGTRGLARGTNSASQIAAAQAAAIAYVNLNFPSGYFFSYNLTIPTPAVDLSVAFQRSVTVTATVTSPALFERLLGVASSTVAAQAVAVRRDVNVMLVMDRSGSLQAAGVCGAVKQAASNFINNFAEGRDNMGLVTFATSAWPDFVLANNFKTANPNMASIVNSVVCNGSTSSAQALWMGYQGLVNLNQPGALNILVFFTDGNPTGVIVDMGIAAGSSCSQKPTIRGHLGTYTDGSNIFGLCNWSVGPQPIANDLYVAPNSTGCTYAQSWNSNMTNPPDFGTVPTQDIYGNALVTGYQPVTTNANGNPILVNTNGIPWSMNAADNAAQRIRNGALGLNNVIIYSIGLGTAPVGAPNQVFLQRVANDPRSPIYDNTKPAGLEVFSQTGNDLGNAFQAIASEILRLAR